MRKARTWDMAAAIFSGPSDRQVAEMKQREQAELAFMASIDRTPKCRVEELGFCSAHDCPIHHGEYFEPSK